MELFSKAPKIVKKQEDLTAGIGLVQVPKPKETDEEDDFRDVSLTTPDPSDEALYRPFWELDQKLVDLADPHKKDILPHDVLLPGTTTLAGMPVRIAHTMSNRARNVITHNQHHEVTRISDIGKTGAGKTTLDWYFIHQIHTIAEKEYGIHYAVIWATKKELRSFGEWIKTLPYGVNLIIVFEDISFETEKMGKKAKLDLKQIMTEIRHYLGDIKLIVFYNYHYTRGLDKQMRDSDLYLITSFSKEENQNMRALFGYWEGPKFANFKKCLKTGTTKGYFIVPCPPPMHNKFYQYRWKQLRICMVDDFGDLGFGLYLDPGQHDPGKYGCNLCVPPDKRIGKEVPAPVWYKTGCDAFGKPKFDSVLRNVLYFMGAKLCYNGTNYDALKWIKKHIKEDRVSLDDLANIVVKEKTQGKTFKQMPKARDEAITRKMEKEMLKEQASKPENVEIVEDAFSQFTMNYGEQGTETPEQTEQTNTDETENDENATPE